MHNQQSTDVAVIGGGPTGSFAAWNLAKLGAKVAVFEEHPLSGKPSHCAGHLSIQSLTDLGLYPLPEQIVENTFGKASFYSPSGYEFSVHLNKPVTCAVNRAAFDEYLSQEAEKSGAHYNYDSRVQSVIIKGGSAAGLSVKQNQGPEQRFSTRVIIDAEGVSSRFVKQMGLSPLNQYKLVFAVETEVQSVTDVQPDTVEVFVGKAYAPGFYAWLIPRLDGTAKVGLATESGDPREFLQRLIRKHPVASRQLAKAKVTRTAFHPISLGGTIAQTYANGFLAVGDAASQVKPTTGGGVILGLTCARIAADVAQGALRRNDSSGNVLQTYQKRCRDAIGFDVQVMLWIRQMLNRLSDEQIDSAIRFCSRISLGENLRDIDEIDFQGQTLLKFLKKPIAFPVLAYFLMLFLSANV